jgi:hypothetical protein
MVKLFAINVFYKDLKPMQKKATYDLSSFGFFQRSRYVGVDCYWS